MNCDEPYFGPEANATRGQTSKIVSNAAGYSEVPTDQTFEDVSSTYTFYQEIQRLASQAWQEPSRAIKPYDLEERVCLL